MGRPKKTIDILPDNWETEIIDLYEVGASDVEIKAYLAKSCGSFSNDLWDRFLAEIEIFSQTIKKGKLLSNAWWEKQGRENLKDKSFSPVLWYMNMKNRFGWRDEKKDNNSETDAEKETIRKIISEYIRNHN